MNKIISILIKNEAYELEVAIKQAAKKELAKSNSLSKQPDYIWPHDDTNDGTPIAIEKLYFRPNYQDYCPV